MDLEPREDEDDNDDAENDAAAHEPFPNPQDKCDTLAACEKKDQRHDPFPSLVMMMMMIMSRHSILVSAQGAAVAAEVSCSRCLADAFGNRLGA